MPRSIFLSGNGRNLKPEQKFKREGLKWLRTRFGKHFFSLAIAGGAYQASGSPDMVCSIRGIAVFIEWKAPNGRVGPKQRAMIEDIQYAGGRAGIVSTWEELMALVDGIEPVQPQLGERRKPDNG
jgi:hypothetical protein